MAADDLPVARVVIDLPLAHLDRPFDYLVPQSMAATAGPGVRVRVRFAGQEVDGFLLERVATSDHSGRLTPLRRVVSAEQVLTGEVLRLARAVADHYAGTLSDVLRLAIPPRHARTEQAAPPSPAAEGARAGSALAESSPAESSPAESSPAESSPAAVDPAPWRDYPAGPALLARLRAGQDPRAVWTPLPGSPWPAIVTAVSATRAAGRGALLVLPDGRDLDRLEPVLRERLGPDEYVRLEADLGPAARYRAFLAALRGRAPVVIGTRAAAFAPVRNLGLIVLWDDGDDSHAEPRAPYPHARDVLALRSELEGSALIVGGWGATAETAAWSRDGWARPVTAPRTLQRHRWPAIGTAMDGARAAEDAAASGRLPQAAWRAIQDGLRRGPVLVQVPRAGYHPGLACQKCRRPARCVHCHGPLRRAAQAAPDCRWCGRTATGWRCPHCAGGTLRATTVGVERTAHELGRAFPGVGVIRPQPGVASPAVPERALVVATPGLEPVPVTGYAAAVLLDGQLQLERPELRAGEQAVRRWLSASALVRSREEGGVVVLCADPATAAAQAVVRTDPGWFADRELAERTELHFPPASVLVAVDGPAPALTRFLDLADGLDGVETLGPVPHAAGQHAAGRHGPGHQGSGADDERVRLLIRTDAARRDHLLAAVRAAQVARSARREPGAVRVQVDPPEPA